MRKILFVSILLMLVGFVSWAQRTVTGSVTDASGQPITGLSVQVKGTLVGTISREEGSYTLSYLTNVAHLMFRLNSEN
jgi:hypothetical protein